MSLATKILAGLGVLLSLSLLAVGQSTDCTNPTIIVPDGRTQVVENVGGTTRGRYFGAFLTAGKSYSVEVYSQYGTGALLPTLGIYNPGDLIAGNPCTGASTVPLAQITDATYQEPSIDTITIGFVHGHRLSFRPTATHDYVFGLVGAATSDDMVFSVSETTLYSPRWAKFTGYFTAWGLQNTTTSTISGVFTMFNPAGGPVASGTINIPANGTVFVDTINGPAPFNGTANGSGFVTFAHNGAPGSIIADAYIDSTSGLFIQPVKFETVRLNSTH